MDGSAGLVSDIIRRRKEKEKKKQVMMMNRIDIPSDLEFGRKHMLILTSLKNSFPLCFLFCDFFGDVFLFFLLLHVRLGAVT